MKKIVLSLICIFLTMGLWAQNQVLEISDQRNENAVLPQTNGFFYMLPKTAIKVDVTVSRNSEIQGYYADYAEKLLGLTNIIKANKTQYKLSDIKISTFEVPDTSHIYYVELSKNQVKNGFLSTIYQNTPSQEFLYDTLYTNFTSQLPDFFKNYSELTYIEEEDSYIVKQLVDSIVTEIPVNTTKKVTKTVAQKAQEAADFIIQIRKDRYNLTSGVQEVPYSQEALTLMIDELNRWERNYLDLFTGITLDEALTYSIIIYPSDENEQIIPLFSLSSDNGFTTSTNSKKPNTNYYLQLNSQVNHNKKSYFLSEKSKEEKYVANNGYKIRKASLANAMLLQDKQIIHTWGLIPILQLGNIETLPAHQDDFSIEKYAIIY